jgi:alpha-beta hydrolase superfamily lysophospholipase
VGHSLGGLIALLAALGAKVFQPSLHVPLLVPLPQEAGVQFAGMVLMGPAIQLDPKVAGAGMVALTMSPTMSSTPHTVHHTLSSTPHTVLHTL